VNLKKGKRKGIPFLDGTEQHVRIKDFQRGGIEDPEESTGVSSTGNRDEGKRGFHAKSVRTYRRNRDVFKEKKLATRLVSP